MVVDGLSGLTRSCPCGFVPPPLPSSPPASRRPERIVGSRSRGPTNGRVVRGGVLYSGVGPVNAVAAKAVRVLLPPLLLPLPPPPLPSNYTTVASGR